MSHEYVTIPKPTYPWFGMFCGGRGEWSNWRKKKERAWNEDWKPNVTLRRDMLTTLLDQHARNEVDSVLLWALLGARLPLHPGLSEWMDNTRELLAKEEE